MFLSTNENSPNDPPFSSNFLHLTSSCDEFPSSHHNNLHLPNFSIRDYVCSYRSKDIKNNWPFSPKSLQLCLSHGIIHPLPPFQPSGAVTNQCGNNFPSKTCSLEEQIIPDVNLGSNQTLTMTGKGSESSKLCLLEIENELRPTVNASKVGTTIKNSGKKCGLLLKSGSCVNRRSKEDNCLTVSESMASKICPICKTFSSASNTTLNAHIDQCLSMDLALPIAKPNRHKIKPRRVRTMIEIYTTAKLCTLEELDERNGTMWATNSKYSNRVSDKSEVSRKGKDLKGLSDRSKEDGINVGPVYVDDKGKKLRILSEFNENSSSMLRDGKYENLKKKSSNEGKGSKFRSIKKKGRHGKKHNRKLVSIQANASEISEYQEGYPREGRQSLKQLKSVRPRLLFQRVVAKRTRLSRKLKKNGDQIHGSCEDRSEDSISFRNPTNKITDLSASVPSYLNKLKIWKNETSFRRKNDQNPSLRVLHSAGKIISTDATRHSDESPRASCVRKTFKKLKKARFRLSDEEIRKWESEMAQEHALMDDDSDDGKTDDILISPKSLISGDNDDDDDDDDGNNEEDDSLDKTNDVNAEFYQICNGNGDNEMCYSEEIEEMDYDQTVNESTELDHGSSFMEVDPIQIPGPPGSFLPSPQAIISDDYHGNSSVITETLQSSQDQIDFTDRNSSESPLSAESNRRISLQSVASSQQENLELKGAINGDKRSFFSCCCQMKERSFESQLLKQRSTMAELGQQSDNLLNPIDPYIIQDSNSMNRMATITPSNPVLRLMGKDLIVVNNGEDSETLISHNESNLRQTHESLDPLRHCGSNIQTVHHGTQLRNPSSDRNIYFGNNGRSSSTEASKVDAFGKSFGLVRYFSPT